MSQKSFSEQKEGVPEFDLSYENWWGEEFPLDFYLREIQVANFKQIKKNVDALWTLQMGKWPLIWGMTLPR